MYNRRKSYIMNNASRDKLRALGFKYNTNISDYENNIFEYHFAAYKYNNVTTIDGIILVNVENGAVSVDVYRLSGGLYSAFYQNEDFTNDVVQSICKKIEKEFRKLGIVEVM